MRTPGTFYTGSFWIVRKQVYTGVKRPENVVYVNYFFNLCGLKLNNGILLIINVIFLDKSLCFLGIPIKNLWSFFLNISPMWTIGVPMKRKSVIFERSSCRGADNSATISPV
jgi:hypothetical protein